MNFPTHTMALAIASALALSACGSSGSKTPSANSTATQKAATEKAAAEKAAAEKAAAEKAAAEKAAAEKAAAEKAAAEKAAAEKAAAEKAVAEKAAAEKAAAEKAAAEKAAAEKAAAEKAAAEEAARKAAEEEAAKKAAEEAAKKAAEEAAAKKSADFAAAFSAGLEKTFVADSTNNARPGMDSGGYGEPKYNGALLSINNETGAVDAQRPTANFEEFTINGHHVLLLATATDKLNASTENATLRPFQASDFTRYYEGNKLEVPANAFNPKDPNNPGWVGGLLKSQWSSDDASNVRYGVYTDANNITHLFAYGTPARFMAQSDRWLYKGDAVFGKDGVYQALPGAVNAIADMKNKTIDVAIDVAADKKLEFGGNITGNTFSGEKNGIETRGGFFGFSSMAGVYQVKNGEFQGYNGAYYGKDQGRIKE